MSETLTRNALLRYAILALPLGFVGLPLYVHLPKLYADTLPLSLTLIGIILFAARILDCALDPLIGMWSDRFAHLRIKIMRMSVVPLILGVVGLFFLPYYVNATYLPMIISSLLILTYLSYSILSINYYASGLLLGNDYHNTSRISAWRETVIVIGVIIASATPQIMMESMGEIKSYQYFALIFAGITLFAWRVFRVAGHSNVVTTTTTEMSLLHVVRNKRLRWLFSIFFFNALPPSITATLFLFFVDDVLQMATMSGVFLLVYFVAAVGAMPLWVMLSKRIGKKRSLLCGMALAISSFVWAFGLGAGDMTQFLLICALSGAALGADLSLLPSLLADELGNHTEQGGAAYGVWNFISKFTLALAAGIALPALSHLGYVPSAGDTASNLYALSSAYALIPCAFKFISFTLLSISPLDQKRSRL